MSKQERDPLRHSGIFSVHSKSPAWYKSEATAKVLEESKSVFVRCEGLLRRARGEAVIFLQRRFPRSGCLVVLTVN